MDRHINYIDELIKVSFVLDNKNTEEKYDVLDNENNILYDIFLMYREDRMIYSYSKSGIFLNFMI